MNDVLKYTIRFLAFVLVQGLVLSFMPPLHRFITPYVYLLFLLWMPFVTGKYAMLFLGFFLGLCLDFFTKTPGLHASACLWVVFFRGGLISLLVPLETRELSSGNPSIKSMGFAGYLLFLSLLTFVHHFWVTLIEWMSFGSIGFFFGKVFLSTLASLILYFVTEMLFRSKSNRRRKFD